MYICDSNVVVTGIASIMHDIPQTPDVRAQTLEALKQISDTFSHVPEEKLERAFWSLAHHHDFHAHG